MISDVLGQLGLVLVVCVTLGALAVWVRLPLLVGLLVAGVVVGPELLGLVAATHEIELLGEIGISLLLFVVGLKLDPRLVRELGPVVLVAGTLQVALTALSTFAIVVAFGLGTLPALYLAAAMSFSSTVVVIKVLTDRGDIEHLHGRVALGILIVQDIVVIAIMVVLSSVDPATDTSLIRELVGVVVPGVLLFGGVAVLARFALPQAVHVLARQGELLVLASVTWAIALAATSIVLGFTAEVGAFAAGVALASSDYREAISGRLATLRDFLLVFFFIDLGTQLRFEGATDLTLIVVLCLFVLVGKPVLIAAITTLLGFHRRVAVLSGLTLAQISEFSLILAALGVSLGHIDGRSAGIVAAVALVTITVSTLLTDRSDALAPILSTPLRGLERGALRREQREASGRRPTVIVIGAGRLGRTVMDELVRIGEDVLGVDIDPRADQRAPIPAPIAFGDVMDPELPHQLPMQRVRWIISTVRDHDANRALIASLARTGYPGRIVVAADHADEVELLRRLGADLVIRPLQVAAEPLMALIHAHDHDLAGRERTLG